MATQEGIVTSPGSLGESTVWIKTVRSSSCEACSAKDSCTSDGGGNDMEVEVLNKIGARVGDRIMLHLETTNLLKATFLLYIFPVICMFGGAFIGQYLALNYQYDPSLFSALGAFISFGIAFLFIKIISNKMSYNDNYKPRIIRILKKNRNLKPLTD